MANRFPPQHPTPELSADPTHLVRVGKILSTSLNPCQNPKWAVRVVIHITAYWLVKTYPNKKAKTIILTLMDDLRIIDCDHETALLALSSTTEDIEDALQYYTALTHEMDIFVSSDKQLRKADIPQLSVLTPAEFLKEVHDQGKN
jgi:hypothetical protein